MISKPHLLPIPFPRGMYVSERFRLSASGLSQVMPSVKDGVRPNLEFLGTMPSLMRTSYDAQYLPHISQALHCLKTLKPSVRAQLLKDYLLEDDEIRVEVRERLERLEEGVRGLETQEDELDDSS